MAKSLLPVTWRNRTTRRPRGSSASPRPRAPARAGQIGPIRREIIFEPVHENPAPVEPPPVAPETQPQEPVPDRT
jgi:hypothetical protein